MSGAATRRWFGLAPLLALHCDCSTYGLGAGSEGTSTSGGPAGSTSTGTVEPAATETSAGTGLVETAAGGGEVSSGAGSTTMLDSEGVCASGPACVRWQRGLVDVDGEQGAETHVGVDGSGHVVVAGGFVGTVDFGKGKVSSQSQRDAFIARYDPDGGLAWVEVFAPKSEKGAAHVADVAVSSFGSIYVVGSTTYDIDLGTGYMNVWGAGDMFAAKYSEQGAPQWSQLIAGAGREEGTHIALDSFHRVVLTGAFSDGTLNLGGGSMIGQGLDAFVLKLTTSGGFMWSEQLGGPGSQSISGLSVDQADDVVVIGAFANAVELGGAAVLTNSGWSDPFLLKMGDEGALLWGIQFDSPVEQGRYATGLTIGAGDSVVVGGWFEGTLDISGQVPLAAANLSPFVARFSEGGELEWGHGFQVPTVGGGLSAVHLDVDAEDAVWMATTLAPPIDLAGGLLLPRGDQDLVLGKYAADGEHLWSGRFGDAAYQGFDDLLVDAAGEVVVAGTFLGTLRLNGGEALLGLGPTPDVFIARLGECVDCE